MKTMKIEKKLLFSDRIVGVDHLDVKAALTYQTEEDGSVRALGPLFIKGNVQSEQGVQPFQEVLDLDVLAPYNKLSGKDFSLQVQECFGEVDEDGINLKIKMGILGLLEEGESLIDANAHEVVEPLPLPIPVQSVVDTHVQEDEGIECDESVEKFEDLFEDTDTTYTSYRMIVAKPQDSYQSIAERYEVNEEDLRSCNRHKDVLPKALIILPF